MLGLSSPSYPRIIGGGLSADLLKICFPYYVHLENKQYSLEQAYTKYAVFRLKQSHCVMHHHDLVCSMASMVNCWTANAD